MCNARVLLQRYICQHMQHLHVLLLQVSLPSLSSTEVSSRLRGSLIAAVFSEAPLLLFGLPLVTTRPGRPGVQLCVLLAQPGFILLACMARGCLLAAAAKHAAKKAFAPEAAQVCLKADTLLLHDSAGDSLQLRPPCGHFHEPCDLRHSTCYCS